MTISEGDRLDYKLALVRLGLRQYQVAMAAGLHESKLSAFLTGRVQLKPDQLERLKSVLGLEEVADVPT
jgi:plasmid maintenance system antidote protein VapI